MKIKNGQTVNVHYVGTLNDGTEFDSSRNRGVPLKFEIGDGRILPAFEKAIVSMDIGEKKKISLTAEQAYGAINSEAIQRVSRTQFSSDVDVGTTVTGQSATGQPIQAIVRSIEDETVTLDFNHPLAGKDINFDLELVSVD